MRTREVSVFIDESGSYEHDRLSSRYYLVCMVFHDQDVDISAEIEKLEDSLEAMGHLPPHVSLFAQNRHFVQVFCHRQELPEHDT